MNCPGSDRCEIREHHDYAACLIAGECQKESDMETVDVQAEALPCFPAEPGVYYVKQWRPAGEQHWRTNDYLWDAPPGSTMTGDSRFEVRILKLRLPV